jgi:Rps23 Pro-64 3,4-dihydroxylase Tpa1-like proline 4-hydroxylase
MPALDFERLEKIARERRAEYAAADPYPHVVIDDFLPAETAEAALEEFDETAEGWKHYTHYNERKMALTGMDWMRPRMRALFEALQSDRFVRFVETLSGIENLLADPDLDGAGMHRSVRGGFLNLHVDFQSHTKNSHWSRQINLLLYLNREWRDEWNGALELWDPGLTRCARKVSPVFNRCLIFNTRAGSYHGHPAPLACPEDVSRKSLALYYFRDEGEAQQLQSTHYRAVPGDPLYKRALVALDRGALRAYSALKRYTPISDGLVSRILRRF